MKKLLTSVLVSFTFLVGVNSQEIMINKVDKLDIDTIWLNKKQIECNKDTATYCRIIKIDQSLNYLVKDYYMTGELYMTGLFTSLKPEEREGNCYWYYITGLKKKMFTYENKIRVKARFWDINGKELKPETKESEKMPEFPGGKNALLEFIIHNLRYPSLAKAARVQGRVAVRFVVDESGKVKDAVVLKSLDPALDAEALRVINLLPKWEPGYIDGQPVSVYFTAPIVYKLQENINNDVKIINNQTRFLNY